jgi:hypothetical protein
VELNYDHSLTTQAPNKIISGQVHRCFSKPGSKKDHLEMLYSQATHILQHSFFASPSSAALFQASHPFKDFTFLLS